MTTPTPIPTSTLDRLLTAQLLVAWAGESGEEPRLAWWRTDLCSEFGGEDLFQRLLPDTWRWATLEATREAAKRADAALRARAHDPDHLVTLFRLGFTVDERLDERLHDLKTSGQPPTVALPGLAELLPTSDEASRTWRRDAFAAWVDGHTAAATATDPAGRRLTGKPPEALDRLADHLVAALAPLGDAYPLPHYRVAR